jgi:hypothetical protein
MHPLARVRRTRSAGSGTSRLTAANRCRPTRINASFSLLIASAATRGGVHPVLRVVGRNAARRCFRGSHPDRKLAGDTICLPGDYFLTSNKGNLLLQKMCMCVYIYIYKAAGGLRTIGASQRHKSKAKRFSELDDCRYSLMEVLPPHDAPMMCILHEDVCCHPKRMMIPSLPDADLLVIYEI